MGEAAWKNADVTRICCSAACRTPPRRGCLRRPCLTLRMEEHGSPQGWERMWERERERVRSLTFLSGHAERRRRQCRGSGRGELAARQSAMAYFRTANQKRQTRAQYWKTFNEVTSNVLWKRTQKRTFWYCLLELMKWHPMCVMEKIRNRPGFDGERLKS